MRTSRNLQLNRVSCPAAVMPRHNAGGSDLDDWPDEGFGLPGGGGAAAGRPHFGSMPVTRAGAGTGGRSMQRQASTPHRLASQGRGVAACHGGGGDGGDAGEDAVSVEAEVRAAAAAVGIDLTGDDDDGSGGWGQQQQQQRLSREQQQRRSAGSAALPDVQRQREPEEVADWRQAGARLADGLHADRRQPTAEAVPWRQRANATASWQPELPGGAAGGGGGEPWYARLPDFVPVGAIQSQRDPRCVVLFYLGVPSTIGITHHVSFTLATKCCAGGNAAGG